MKWMFQYKVRITFVPDESVSLNDFKATLTGSDLDVTDVGVKGQPLDKILEAYEEEQVEVELDNARKEAGSNYAQNGKAGSRASDRPAGRPSRPKRRRRARGPSW